MEMAVEVVQSGIGACAARSSGHRAGRRSGGQQQEDSFMVSAIFRKPAFQGGKEQDSPAGRRAGGDEPAPRDRSQRRRGASASRERSDGAM